MTVILGRPRPLNPSAFGIPSSRPPVALVRQVNESDAAYQTAAGNQPYVILDTLKSTQSVPNVATKVPIRTRGGLLLIDIAFTMAHGTANSISSFDVWVDGVSVSQNTTGGVCNRGGEIAGGSGQAYYHAVVSLPAGLHRVDVMVRQHTGGGTSYFVLMNSAGGVPNDGYFKMSLLELNPAYGRATAPMSGLTAHVASPQAWLKPLHPKSAIIATAAENEGACTTTSSTSWVTWDSIRPAGMTTPRMTRRFWSSGGYFFFCVHATFDAVSATNIGYMDIAVDGVRISGSDSGLDNRTQVTGGNLCIAYFGPSPHVQSGAASAAPPIRRIPRGWHTAELMVRTSGASGCVFNSMGASGGTTNDGWTVMVVAEMS